MRRGSWWTGPWRPSRASQHNDGGWDYGYVGSAADRTAPSGVDLTGAALGALCTAGARADDPAVRQGVAFLRSRLITTGGAAASEGGFDTQSPYGPPPPTPTPRASRSRASTRAGSIPQGERVHLRRDGLTPIDFLRSLRTPSGAFKHD